jgi:hypothetical protein
VAVDDIQQVLKEQTPKLMAIPGVVGTAIGGSAAQPCIKVYVVEETDAIRAQIEATLGGQPVIVQPTGSIRAL